MGARSLDESEIFEHSATLKDNHPMIITAEFGEIPPSSLADVVKGNC